MLVIISDLHFEEEESNYVGPKGGQNSIEFSRNLPKEAFQLVVARLAKDIDRCKADRLDLVFAGDIFDLHRTGLWFTDDESAVSGNEASKETTQNKVRPYVSNVDVPKDKKLVKKLEDILEAIQNANGVRDALSVFRLLAQGKYIDHDKENGNKEQDFPLPVEKIKFHYIPGNHDRLINGAPTLRAAVRHALGMAPSDEKFPNFLPFPQYHTFVRHGQEYDPINFSHDYTRLKEEEKIPLEICAGKYNAPPVGDFTTVDIASRIPRLMREKHEKGEIDILNDSTVRALYCRLLDFDDLRPQSALFNYLINMPAPENVTAEYWADNGRDEVWKIIKPILRQVIEESVKNKFLRDGLAELKGTKTIRFVLATGLWRLLFIAPLGLLERFSRWIVNGVKARSKPQDCAAEEAALDTDDYYFIVAGHTHHPATEIIAKDKRGERYYVDTGTWRNQVPATSDLKDFGRLKSLTYAVIYGPNEDLGGYDVTCGPKEEREEAKKDKLASLDFWSGVTQRWKKPEPNS